jgi:hypothetical protein
VTYVFNEGAAAFLQIVTSSGTDYVFLKAMLDYPQAQTPGSMPPFLFSKSGFLSQDPAGHPYFVKLQIQVAHCHFAVERRGCSLFMDMSCSVLGAIIGRY